MQSALTIQNLVKTYANGTAALKDINLDVQRGDFFALLGPNGAGKSTTIGIVASLVTKTSGKVHVFGHDTDNDLQKAKSYIGIVPQEFNFSIFEKPIEILVNQAGYYGMPRQIALERAEEYLKRLGLWEKHNKPSIQLSGGMKRRLMIARALVHRPELLILDEPTAGVDIEIRHSMWNFLREINEQGTTIILTTHYLEEAESLCKKIAIIDKGKIIENTSMKNLLRQLNAETFVLYLKKPLLDPEIPQLENFVLRAVDELTLEVEVQKDQQLNDLFTQLTTQGIEIASMRNKANRLETLFLHLISTNNVETKHE